MMTVYQLRNLPIGGGVWYFCAELSHSPKVKVRHNDKPKHLRKVETAEPLRDVSCTFVDDDGKRYGVYYALGCNNLFTSEKSAWIGYFNKMQEMIKEVERRKREYCKTADDTISQLRSGYIDEVAQFLNRGDENAD